MEILLTIYILFFIIPFLFFIKKINIISNISNLITLFIFFIYIYVFCYYYDIFSNGNFYKIFINTIFINSFNFEFIFAIDSISILFLLLTSFLIFICSFIGRNSVYYNTKEYYILFLSLELLLIFSFSSLNILLFFFFFESILIPMFFIISIFGTERKKIKASLLFFFFTLIGSSLMLYSIIFIFIETGSFNFFNLFLYEYPISYELFYWSTFFISFAIKIPMVPFHIWLPEAHVEAPTPGSIILAGILLKLGGYGIIRFLLVLFPNASFFFIPYIKWFAIFSMLYSSFLIFTQTDLKKIVAYASISHMNFIILGLFYNNIDALQGSILQMLSHGLVSSGLFFSIGNLYERYHTRFIKSFGGLYLLMPKFSFFFFIYILSNISFPGTSNFIGELLIYNSICFNNTLLFCFSMFQLFLGVGYSFIMFNKISFGNFSKNFNTYIDILPNEVFIHCIFLILILILGIFPTIFLKFLEGSLKIINSFSF
jgi:proton-translocating NADH-quinone oxidoreductase chain M